MTDQELAKEQAEVMLAYADGKEIEWSRCGENEWKKSIIPMWNWSNRDYRVKPAEPKKVILLGYIDEFKYVRYAAPEFKAPVQWTRVPSLDIEYEVTE